MTPRTKKAPPSAAEHFRLMLRRWVDEHFHGNQTAAAQELGSTQGHLSALMNGSRGPGVPFLLAFREKSGISLDAMFGLEDRSDVAQLARGISALNQELVELKAAQRALLERTPHAPIVKSTLRPKRSG